jgi:hypothetical protein
VEAEQYYKTGNKVGGRQNCRPCSKVGGAGKAVNQAIAAGSILQSRQEGNRTDMYILC